MALNAASKSENLLLSFCKHLYDNVGASFRNKINYLQERWSPENQTTWAEVDWLKGADGYCKKPWLVSIVVYSRPEEDEFAHAHRELMDVIKAALNSTSVSIYDFGATDLTRANPVDTTLSFYPLPNGGEEPVSDLVGGNIRGTRIVYKCFSVRPDMWGA